MKIAGLGVLVWAGLALGSEPPVRIVGMSHPIGYSARLERGSAVSASHLFTIPRRLNRLVQFSVGDKPCRVMVCPTADLCFVEYDDSCSDESVELAEEEDDMLLGGRPVRLLEAREYEIIFEWEDWIEKGMSGSAVYTQDGRIVAVLSRIKCGEYAVAVKVRPFVKT